MGCKTSRDNPFVTGPDMRLSLAVSCLLAGLCPVLAPAPAHADYDETQLYSAGAWHVSLTHDTTDGDLWCSADTENGEGQTFSITTYSDGQAAVLVIDPRWSLSNRSVDFFIDIDRSRWNITGTAKEISVSVMLQGEGKAAEFLVDLARGNSVNVVNTDERRLANFSLHGSSRALNALLTCWKEIATSDPFAGQADPF